MHIFMTYSWHIHDAIMHTKIISTLLYYNSWNQSNINVLHINCSSHVFSFEKCSKLTLLKSKKLNLVNITYKYYSTTNTV